MSFWGALFGGQNPTLNATMAQSGQIGGFATSLGEKNLTNSSNFWNSILSGNSSKTMQALAPEVNAAKGAAAQDNKTAAEFGTRSGGTAASTAATNDKVHANITDLVGRLTGSAASELGNSGQSLLGTGLNAFNQQAEMSQEQIQNWSDSILGRGITTGVSFAESYGLNSIPGAQSSSDLTSSTQSSTP